MVVHEDSVFSYRCIPYDVAREFTFKDVYIGEKKVKVKQEKAAPKIVICKTVNVVCGAKTYQAVCMPDDSNNFDLERGFEVCLLKIYSDSLGTDHYKAIKELKRTLKKCDNDRAEKERIEKKKAKVAAKKEARRKRKEEDERQKRIDEKAQAIYRAMKLMKENGII